MKVGRDQGMNNGRGGKRIKESSDCGSNVLYTSMKLLKNK